MVLMTLSLNVIKVLLCHCMTSLKITIFHAPFAQLIEINGIKI